MVSSVVDRSFPVPPTDSSAIDGSRVFRVCRLDLYVPCVSVVWRFTPCVSGVLPLLYLSSRVQSLFCGRELRS